jgi:hypothetical protein
MPNKLTDLNIIEAAQHKDLFASWFKKRFFQEEGSWERWFSFLRVLFGHELGEADVDLFHRCTGRTDKPDAGFTEAWLICGRRAGKSFVISLVATFLACFVDWRPYLQHGERGTIVILAVDRAQCQTIFRFIVKMIEGVKVLRPLITRQTNELIELSNNISIEISTASFRTVRSRSIVAALCDEISFWSDEGSNPDTEVIRAIRPAMGMVPGSMLLCASSPYARRGALFDAYSRDFGKNGSDVLIWKASTKTMNPTFPQHVIDRAYEKDAADAAAEYGAEFRSDLESFVDRDLVESLVIRDRRELAPVQGVEYFGFVDPAGGSGGGSGGDSMTMAIAHKESNGYVVLDCIREAKPPFSPHEVVRDFIPVLQSYGLAHVTGDAFGGLFAREPFLPLEYVLARQRKSDIYRDVLALLNSRMVQLLDNPALIAQLCNLERSTARGGRDSIDHPRGQHDDVCNSAMGAILLANTADQRRVRYFFHSLDGTTYGDHGDGGVIIREGGSAGSFGARNVYTGSSNANAYRPPVHIPTNNDFLRDGGCNSQQQ